MNTKSNRNNRGRSGGRGKSKSFNKKRTTSNKESVSKRDKRKYIDFKEKVKKGDPLPTFNENEIRLNKYLSNAGICSRREADVLIKTGVVTVNGNIVTEMASKYRQQML